MDELKCLACGHIGEPISKAVYENADADGNRGIWVTYDYCEECGDEDLTEDFDKTESSY